MKATQEQTSDSSYRPTEKKWLRISKSSLMTYMMCPRQFYWRYIADIPSPPPSEAAIRGGKIHKVMEIGLLEGSDKIMSAAIEEGVADDVGVDSLNMLLHQIAHDMGGFDIVEAEIKHQVAEEYNGYNIIWVGMIDGVIRHPDGGLILMELKTGKMNMGKLGRTRKELVYYSRLLSKLGYDEPITHFMYISPDYEIPEDGNDKLNLHSILSIPLLKELIAYDKDGNFDRAIAFMLCILHSHENYNIDLEAQFDYGMGDKFWRTSHFKRRKVRF